MDTNTDEPTRPCVGVPGSEDKDHAYQNMGSGHEAPQPWAQADNAEVIGHILHIGSQSTIGTLKYPEHLWDICQAP